jgi:hypothetical protein
VKPLFLIAAAVFLIGGIFARPLCEFNASIINSMPGFVRWAYKVQYLGSEPDSDLWVGVARWTAFAGAAASLFAAFAYRPLY